MYNTVKQLTRGVNGRGNIEVISLQKPGRVA